MSSEPGPKTASGSRSWLPWAGAALWLIVVLVAMFALGGFRGLFLDRGATATAVVVEATEEAEATMAAQQQAVAEAVIATLTSQPTPIPTDTVAPTATPTPAATETPAPAPTSTPEPDWTATWEAEVAMIAAAIAATETAQPTETLAPTATPSETVDVEATETAHAERVIEAIEATEAAKPTDTPVPAVEPPATADVGAAEAAVASQVAESVAATQTAQPTPTTTPIPPLTWPLILADPFTTDENGWPTGESDSPSGWESRSISDAAYRWEVDTNQGMVVLAHPSVPLVGDCYVSVEGKQVTGPRTAEYGLVFRQTDEDNLYSFGARSDGRFGVFALTHGEWSSLIDWTHSTAIRPDGVNKLAVWAQGTSLRFYINDEPVAETEDDRLLFGEVGLLAEVPAGVRASFVFDAFELRASAAPALPTPPATQAAEEGMQAGGEECIHADTDLIPDGMELLVCDSFSSSWNVQDSNLDHLMETRTVENGKYRWTIDTEHGLFSQASPSIGPVRDFYASVVAQQISGTERAEHSLMFRKVDDDNLYTFSVRHDGTFGVFGIRNGEWIVLVDWSPTDAIRRGEANRLTIRAKGRRTVLFINDQRVTETSEIPPSEGEVGIAVELPAGTEAVFDFDDFELRTPENERPRLESGLGFDASACSHESVLAPAGWPIVFCNAFESDAAVNRLGWPLGDSTNKYASTKRRIAYGKYIWESDAYLGVFSPAVPDLEDISDFYLTVLGRLRSGPNDASYGVMFRRLDRQNFYFFEISENQYYQFSVKDDGKWETLIPWTESEAISPDHAINRITVVGLDDEFEFFVNDQYVDRYSDNRFAVGTLGLAIELFGEGDKGSFDWGNFEVHVPVD